MSDEESLARCAPSVIPSLSREAPQDSCPIVSLCHPELVEGSATRLLPDRLPLAHSRRTIARNRKMKATHLVDPPTFADSGTKHVSAPDLKTTYALLHGWSSINRHLCPLPV
jgi:hypothetical protein